MRPGTGAAKLAPMALLSPGQKRIRRAIWLCAGLLVFLLFWWGLNRATAPFRELRLVGGKLLEEQAARPLSQLRIGIWNMAHGRGLAGSNWSGGNREVRLERLRAIAGELKSRDLDVVVLNEVDFDSTWSDRVNQAQVIAREMGLANRAEQRNVDLALPFFKLRFGNVLLSRFPISDARVVGFPGYSGIETFLGGKKKGLLCTLDLPGKKKVRVLALHLEHRSEEVRISAARIIERVRTETDIPLIAAGDFNSTPREYPRATPDKSGQTAISLLLSAKGFKAAIKKSPSQSDFTFRSDAPRNAIDWVLAPPGWTILEHTPLDSRLSDHRPVIARLSVPK